MVTASGPNAYAINLSVRAGSPYVSGTFRFETDGRIINPIFIIDTLPYKIVSAKKKEGSVRIRFLRAIEIAIFVLSYIRTFLQLYY